MNAEAAADWLDVADRDEAAATLLLNAAPPQIETAIYHVQQWIEKTIKGLLTLENIHPPHTHDLERLEAALPASHPLGSAVAKVSAYGGWAVMARYPDVDPATADPLPSVRKVRDVMADAAALRDAVRKRIEAASTT